MKDDSLCSLPHRTIVFVTETFSIFASTLSQKWLTKRSKFCISYIKRFFQMVQIETKTFNVSVIKGNLKCPIGKSIFAVNLPLKLFRDTVANLDTGSFKYIYTLSYTYLDHMLAKYVPNRMIQNVQF